MLHAWVASCFIVQEQQKKRRMAEEVEVQAKYFLQKQSV